MLKRNKLPKPLLFLSKVNEESSVCKIPILPPEIITMVRFKMSHLCEAFCHLLFRSLASSLGVTWEEPCWCVGSGLR